MTERNPDVDACAECGGVGGFNCPACTDWYDPRRADAAPGPIPREPENVTKSRESFTSPPIPRSCARNDAQVPDSSSSDAKSAVETVRAGAPPAGVTDEHHRVAAEWARQKNVVLTAPQIVSLAGLIAIWETRGRRRRIDKTLNLCPVCRVDRVKRWADLNGIARDRGLPHGGLDVETMTHVPIARALAKARLIQYDREDGAWELTQAGLDALRELDGENRRAAIAEWEARRARFEEEHAEQRRAIDRRFPAPEPFTSTGNDEKGKTT